MRIDTKLIIVAVVAVLLVALPAAAQTVPAPGTLPNVDNLLPPPAAADVARFEFTINGIQSAAEDFHFNPTPDIPCGPESAGTLSETWQFLRGRGVVMEFRRLSPTVMIMRRAGRSLGDTAFNTRGPLKRSATGSFAQILLPSAQCGEVTNNAPPCGTTFNVPSDLFLSWSNGRLKLDDSPKTKQRKNPAIGCGAPALGPVIDELSFPYPMLDVQSAKLPLRKIFGSSRSFRLQLTSRSLDRSFGPAGYTEFSETITGTTDLTFRRLPNN